MSTLLSKVGLSGVAVMFTMMVGNSALKHFRVWRISKDEHYSLIVAAARDSPALLELMSDQFRADNISHHCKGGNQLTAKETRLVIPLKSAKVTGNLYARCRRDKASEQWVLNKVFFVQDGYKTYPIQCYPKVEQSPGSPFPLSSVLSAAAS